MPSRWFVFAVLVSVLTPASAQETVFVIRHAEKELEGLDPALTIEGRERAAKWAEMLAQIRFDVVATSDAQRTIQTGTIISDKFGLELLSFPRAETTALVDELSFEYEDGTVLVVGHAETIPHIIAALGVPNDVAIDQSDFANLFVVQGISTSEPSLIHLRMP